MKRSYALLLVMSLGALTSACGSAAGDYCDAACDCVGCSDKEYDECIADYEYSEDLASAYDCDGEYADLEDCVFDRADCDRNPDRYGLQGDECNGQQEDLYRCIDHNSDIFDIPGPG